MPKKRTITVFIIISLIVFSFFVQRIESGTIEDKPEMIIPQSKDDLQITLVTNKTIIGKQGGVLGNLTLNNTGINPCGSISANFTLSGDYLNFTSTYQTYQEVALLNPGSSITLNIEAAINDSGSTSMLDVADVCLIIDASGSMGAELSSAKAELLALILRLQNSISDLRMGVIVHGWQMYSEYPMDDPRNYIEFTDDAQSVSDFVAGLTADGGFEPWGDALYLASTWDWREGPKLIVMVGDEDCDPGRVIGVGVTSSYYNGSQLVDVVNDLASMGVILNTIRCSTDAMVVNQFTWIAEVTGGISVDLNTVLSGEFPGGIPELIEHWTLELAREYYVTIFADVSWTELDTITDPVHDAQVLVDLIVDLAPPDITVTTYINPIAVNDYTIEIYATIKDKSNITHANIYWTDDDINGTPTWHFNMMTLIGDIYYFDLNHLVENQKISFYIQSSDIVSNVAVTDIFNKTIVVTHNDIGVTLDFVLTFDNSTRYLLFDLDTFSIGYLWLKSEQQLNLNFSSTDDFTFEELFTDGFDSLHKITKIAAETVFSLALNGNTSSESITLHYNIQQALTQEILGATTIVLNDDSPNYLLSVTLSDPSSGYLSMIMLDYQLLAVAYVFDSNWDYIGSVSAAVALSISAGTYHIWVVRTLRDGILQLRYSETPYTTTDQYYAMGSGFDSLAVFVGISFLLGILTIKRKKGKRVRKKLS
ncbi:MAG: vWA domain-containing protein [Candidatus Heimdallarchaeota archaeon]